MEELPAIDSRAWSKRKWFPRNWHDAHELEHYIAPGIARVILSRARADVFHSGGKQAINIFWQRSDLGPRPMFICSCKRRAFKLRLIRGAFQCKRCCGVPYLSQAVTSRQRPIVQAARLKRFIDRWDGSITLALVSSHQRAS
jgi:hypothetical protein